MNHVYSLLSLLILLSVAPVLGQTTRYVETTGNDTGNDCAIEGSPCATIGHAIDEASPGDLIQIASGAYTESITIDKSLSLIGEHWVNTWIQAHDQQGQATSRVVTIEPGIEASISRVTIRHGVADGIGLAAFGGGIFAVDASVSLSEVRINLNSARNGGGVYSEGDTNGEFDDVGISFNDAEDVGGGMYNKDGHQTFSDVGMSSNEAGLSGGGLYNLNSAVTMTDTYFGQNVAQQSGGGVYVQATNGVNELPTFDGVRFENNEAGQYGGGLHFSGASNPANSSELTDVLFSQNEAPSGGGAYLHAGEINFLEARFEENATTGVGSDGGGGGMFVYQFADPTLQDVLFEGNTTMQSGGGMRIHSDDPVSLTNVLFTGNEADGYGGGVRIQASSPEFRNVTFQGNTSNTGGGAVALVNGGPDAANTIFWGNLAGDNGNEVYVGAGAFDTRYSLYSDDAGDIVGDFTAFDSLTVDPLFVDAGNGDLRLMENSPAIDAGYPLSPHFDFPIDENGDPVDLDGNPRFFNTTIDLGAYEWQGNVSNETSPNEGSAMLSAPAPNPVRGTTTLTLRVAESQRVNVEVFDALGRRVQTLHKGPLAAGTSNTLTLDASALPVGVYVVRATGEGFSESRQVTVVK